MWCADKAVKLKNTYPKINQLQRRRRRRRSATSSQYPGAFMR